MTPYANGTVGVGGNGVLDFLVELQVPTAAELFRQRTEWVDSWSMRVRDLVRLDDRLSSHLEAVALADGRQLARWSEASPDPEQPELLAVLVSVWLERGESRLVTALIEAAETEGLEAAIHQGLAWADFDRSKDRVREWLMSPEPKLQRAAVRTCAGHRRSLGDRLPILLDSSDAGVVAAACEAAGLLGRRDLVEVVRERLAADVPSVRLRAAWASSVLGVPPTRELRAVVAAPSPSAMRAFGLAIRAMAANSRAEARAVVDTLIRREEHVAWGILGTAALGEIAWLDVLIDQLNSPELARFASHAILVVLGDGALECLAVEQPADESAHDSVVHDTPSLDPDCLRDWWSGHARQYGASVRYLAGEPIERESLLRHLGSGRQSIRVAAATEWALLHPGTRLFPTDERVVRQLPRLESLHQSGSFT